MADKQVFVEREPYVKNDKSYFSYFVKGVIRGKNVRAALVPSDTGGYALLEIVFGDEMQAELTLKPYEIKDEASGNVITGNSYGVRSVDKETGEIFECPIKPFRKSDKTILAMLVR